MSYWQSYHGDILDSIIRTTDAAQEPITVAEVKTFARIDTDADDTILGTFITAARQVIEREIGRSLITQTWQIKRTGWLHRGGHLSIELPYPKIQGVTSLVYLDTNGNSITLATDQYRVLTSSDISGCIVPEYGVSWPSLRCVDHNITVTYTAGYGDDPDDVPQGLRDAIKFLVTHWYENRDAYQDKEKKSLPKTLQYLLSIYKVPVIK